MAIQYRFYATLLDSFQWFLESEEETAFQGFIDKINRVPFTSEAAERGTAFNTLIDEIKNGKLNVVSNTGVVYWNHSHGAPCVEVDDAGLMQYGKFAFNVKLVLQFVKKFERAIDQVYTEATLDTPKGDVLLYGYLDEVNPGALLFDIKTTGQYNFPKYLGNWQHIVYPYCMQSNGIDANQFTYEITDFKNIYREDYTFHPERDVKRLREICMRLIDFIETHRDLITDKKIFNVQAA